MTHTLPYLKDQQLFLPKEGTAIVAETREWYSWLEQHSSFAFTDISGRTTIRKERSGFSGTYWKAYRKHAGKVYSAYIGRSSDLTLDRLQAAVQSLAIAPISPISLKLVPSTPVGVHPAHDTARLRPGDTLLRTKFFVPPVRRQRVARARLLDRLRDDSQSLVLIAAPAGFGKTTLIADWIATDQRMAIWLALDAGDNDPIRFWMAVALACDTLQPGVCMRALRLLRSPQPSLNDALPILINDLSLAFVGDARDRPALLVLDDYHVIEDRSIHETVTRLLDRLPAQLRLVIVSRGDSALPLPKLRVRGQLAELRAADLAFTSSEVAAFLGETMNLALADELVAALFQRTEGWVAPLQLAALSLHRHANPAAFVNAFSGSDRHVLAYLIDEVFSRQPEPIQTFLLHTCILERMCAPLCDAVIGNAGLSTRDRASDPQSPAPGLQSQLLLEELERANLFMIALDDQHYWYRYHHLFAEMLLQRLRNTAPALEMVLRRRASEWYAHAGYLPEAITQALIGRDWLQAAHLIEQVADALWRRSEFGVLEGWLNTLPEEIVRERPRLGLALATVLCAKKEFDMVGVVLDAVERGLTTWDPGLDADRPDPLPPVPVLWARLAAIRAQVARILGDLDQARMLAQQALDGLPHDDDWRTAVTVDLALAAYFSEDLEAARRSYSMTAAMAQKAGNHYLLLFSLSMQASCLIDLGSLQEASALLEQTRRLIAASGVADLPITSYADAVYALVCYEKNDLAGAERILLHSLETAGQGRLMDIRAFCSFLLAQIHLMRRDLPAALAALDQADSIFHQMTSFGQSPIPWRRMYSTAWRAKIHAAEGHVSALIRWADEIAAEVDPASVPLMSRYYRLILLMQARARLLQDRPAAALDLLEPWQARVARAGYNDALIEILALRALALDRLERRPEALEILTQALHLAAPEGYVRTFVDEGAPMAELLRAAYWHSIERKYVLMLLAAIDSTADEAPQVASRERKVGSGEEFHVEPNMQATDLVESLNERELEILRLIAAGYSNRAIAEQLVLALSTVKWYLRHIYGKLDVSSRTQALIRAAALGLLE